MGTLALLIGIFLGSRSENGQFGNFNGSRPLTDSQIANAVLSSVTVGVLASALIWAAFMAAALLLLELRTGRSSFQSMIEQFESLRLLGVATLGMGALWGGVGLMT